MNRQSFVSRFSSPWCRSRVVSSLAVALTAVLTVTLIGQVPAFARAPRADRPDKDKSVDVRAVKPRAAVKSQTDTELWKQDRVAWPAPGSAVVDLSTVVGRATPQRVRAGQLPVSIGNPVSQVRDGVSRLPVRQASVEVLSQEAAKAAGVQGLLLRMSRVDDIATDGVVSVEVDYSAFRAAFGGNWASRLRLVRLPACVVKSPQAAECRVGTPVGGVVNNQTTSRLTASVEIPLRRLPAVQRQRFAGDPQAQATNVSVFAVSAAAVSSQTGDFRKTPLAPSFSWQAGTSGGDFTWSYPVRVPPAPGGLEPGVTFSYASSSVDGRTNSENSQTSWLGEGWDYQPGYIERSYRACKDDTANAPYYTNATDDLCWRDDNATIVWNGRSTELIRDDTAGKWRLADDDGSRVDYIVGGVGNYDNDGEKWKITTRDGTQYWFGLNRLPNWVSGNRETNSAWNVPVFANHSGEPCFKTGGFAASYCIQAWRWNLDYVVDPHGNTVSYWYIKEQGRVGLAGNVDSTTIYDRGGWALRAEYGTRTGQELATTTPPMQVVFTTGGRCLSSCLSGATPIAASWPDTPWDLHCGTAATSCSLLSPVFWIHEWLTTITTQVLVGSSYVTVDEWALDHVFPATLDGTSASPWLDDIVHTGKVGGSVALPTVHFGGTRNPNRTDYNTSAGVPPVNKFRLAGVYTETGGQIIVTYDSPDCSPTVIPADPATNTMRCFPQYYDPPDATPGWSWWNKYRVASVAERDLVGGAANDHLYTYGYSNAGSSTDVLWHHDGRAWGSLLAKRSWSDWRGYSTVTVTEGAASETQTQHKYLYFRGMDGDRTDAGEFTRDAKITDSENEVAEDQSHLAGFLREETEYASPGGQVLSKTIHTPWQQQTAYRQEAVEQAQPSKFWAYYTDVAQTRTWTWLAGPSTWRQSKDDYTYDTTYGQQTATMDSGDVAVTGDERCTTTTYARTDTTTAYLIEFPAEETNTDCVANPAPANILSGTRRYYDGSTTLGAGPSRGLETRVDDLASFSGTTPNYVTTSRAEYDALGRPINEYDALGHVTTTAYTPSIGAVTTVAETNPAGHLTTTTLNPAWGLPTVEIDANNKRTEVAYDALGRLIKKWLPGRTTSDTPNTEYGYTVSNTVASSVLTKELGPNGNQIVSYEIFDGLLRSRQVQSTAPDGKRVIDDTAYDSRGLAIKESSFYNSASAPAGTLMTFADPDVGVQRRYTFDGAERKLTDQMWSVGAEMWRTTTTYDGDRSTTLPPSGGTIATSVVDVFGQLTELRQYKGAAATGAYDTTRYTYDLEGQLTKVTDPAGNHWDRAYDLRGRLVSVADPDTGTTQLAYNDADQLITSTDQRGTTLAYTYDNLGRPTARYQGSTSGTKLASWGYDTLAKGTLTSASRYDGANTYTNAVTGYNDLYQPTGASVTIPGVEGALAGMYTFAATYKPDGSTATVSYPAAGGLAAETVTYAYATTGVLSSAVGADTYVSSASYAWDGLPVERILGGSNKRVRLSNSYGTATRRLSQAQVQTEHPGSPGTWDEQLTQLYQYNPAGSVTGVDDQRAGATVSNECFGYDYLRRLTEAWTTTVSTCQATPTQAVVGGPDPYWSSYTYDLTGNRTSEIRHSATGGITRTSTYPAAGQPQPHTLRSLTTGSSTGTYAYDTAGQTTSRPGATGQQTLTWDPEGHLTAVAEGTTTTSLIYDANGTRLIRRDAAGSTLYLGSTELRRSASGAVAATRNYTFNGDTVAVRTTSDGLSWLAADHHGTGQLAINAGTLATTRRKTLPFGETRGAAPTAWPNEKGFVGGDLDPTGLIHLGARDYDPATGRFVSADPLIDLGDPQQMNGYAYANNNPTTMSDPSGLKQADVCGYGYASGTVVCGASGIQTGGSNKGAKPQPNFKNNVVQAMNKQYEEERERRRENNRALFGSGKANSKGTKRIVKVLNRAKGDRKGNKPKGGGKKGGGNGAKGGKGSKGGKGAKGSNRGNGSNGKKGEKPIKSPKPPQQAPKQPQPITEEPTEKPPGAEAEGVSDDPEKIENFEEGVGNLGEIVEIGISARGVPEIGSPSTPGPAIQGAGPGAPTVADAAAALGIFGIIVYRSVRRLLGK